MVIARTAKVLILCALLVCIFPSAPIYSEESLKSEAETYLNEHSNKDADSRWRRTILDRAAQAVLDSPSISSEESFADDRVLEFFFDKKKIFESSNVNSFSAKDKIEVARWYLLYSDKGWRFPARIAEHLTKSNFERYVASK